MERARAERDEDIKLEDSYAERKKWRNIVRIARAKVQAECEPITKNGLYEYCQLKCLRKCTA